MQNACGFRRPESGVPRLDIEGFAIHVHGAVALDDDPTFVFVVMDVERRTMRDPDSARADPSYRAYAVLARSVQRFLNR